MSSCFFGKTASVILGLKSNYFFESHYFSKSSCCCC